MSSGREPPELNLPEKGRTTLETPFVECFAQGWPDTDR